MDDTSHLVDMGQALKTIEEDVARLAGIVEQFAQVQHERKPEKKVRVSSLVRLAETLVKESDMRAGVLSQGMLADPAWHILLDLFIAGERGKDISISSACIAARVPPTTALRWIDNLRKQGILVRTNDPRDGRRVYIGLSLEARLKMKAYLRRIADQRRGRLPKRYNIEG